MNEQKIQKFIFIFLLILIISFIFVYHGAEKSFSLEQMHNHINDYGIWAPLVFLSLYIIFTTFAPSSPFMALAGVLFGFKYGILYSIIGNLISALIMFYIARILGKSWVDKILEHRHMRHINSYNKRLESGATIDLIILRMAPIMPSNILNIMMGVSKMKLKPYIIGTVIGLIPSIFITVYFGELISKIL